MVDLVVSIVNTDRRELLRQCLTSLPAALGDLSFTIVVLDNASRDGSPNMVLAHEVRADLIRQECRRGFGANHNTVLSQYAFHARYALLLNEDTELTPRSLERMVAYMDQHASVGLTGARLLNGDGSPQSSYATFPSVFEELIHIWKIGRLIPKRRRAQIAPFLIARRSWLPAMTATYLSNWTNQIQEPTVVDWVCGACLMVRSEVVHRIGLLDEGFFIYFEETDWCKRAAAAGWQTVYLPKIEVQHHEAASRGRLSIIEFQRSGRRYFAKHGHPVDQHLFRFGVWLHAVCMVLWSSVQSLRPSQRASSRYSMETYRQICRDTFRNTAKPGDI